MADSFSKSIQLLPAILLGLISIVSSVSGQKVDELNDSELNEKVIALVGENQFLEARPLLLEMQKRAKENENAAAMEPIDFFLASSYLEEYQNDNENKEALKTAVKQFEQYLEKHSGSPRKTVALLNLGDAHSDLDNFKEAIEAYLKIYNAPATSGSVRNDIRRVIAKTFLKTETPELGMVYYQEAYDQSFLDEEARAEAATWLLQGYLAKGEIEAILPYFNNLTGRKAALFNPKFNVTLIKAGDGLFEKGNFDFAILFYAIVKKKEDIVRFYEQSVQQLKLALSYREKGSEAAITIEKRLREAEANLKAVRGVRDYDADVRWRTARVLLESERTWEALWSFYNLMRDYPEHEQAEEFLFLAFSQARAVNDFVMVEQLAQDYLGRVDYKKYRGQVTLDLATYYQGQGEHQKFYDLARDYLDGSPDQDKAASQLANLLSIHLLEREQYGEVEQRMSRYNQTHLGLPSTQEATKYWKSLALLIQADYEQALAAFNEFIDKYGESSRFSEDAFYRRAIALYGVGQPDAAYDEFSEFVDLYPGSNRRGEAELYLGDIKREQGMMDAALAHYRRVEENTNTMSFITKATFAISEVLEMGNEEEESADILLRYIEGYGLDAELAEAYLRLGNFEQRRGNIAKRFEYSKLGLAATGNLAERYNADRLLIEYAEDFPMFVTHFQSAVALIDTMLTDPEFRDKLLTDRAFQFQYFESEEGQKIDPNFTYKLVRDRIFRRQLLDDPEAVLLKIREDYSEQLLALTPLQPQLLFDELTTAAQGPAIVLKLRLAMARDILDDSPGLVFPFSDEQVLQGSPAVILWRAKQLRELNPVRANALLQASVEMHPFAPNLYDTRLLMAQIARQRALAESSPANWQQALLLYEDIIQRFGLRSDDGEPFLAKGEILIELNQPQQAIDVLSDVMRNPEWRGEPQAKAHLLLGIAYFKQDRFEEAHGFFERLMIGFGSFHEQVALAYFWDLKTLQAMNETESMLQLLASFREREDLSGTEGYRLIKENYAL